MSSMEIALICAAIGFAFFYGIKKAVEKGARDAHQPPSQPITRRGYGWHRDDDKRAR